MKKYFILFVILASMCAAGFSEEMDGNSAGERGAESHDVLNLNVNFLEHTPGLINFMSYQNQFGEPFSYKEVNAMLISVPENEQLMRRHRFWRGATWTFAGILLACIAADTVYTCVDGLPQENAVMTAASVTGACSFLCALLSGYVSTTQYLKAVDNYNKQFKLTTN
ncbi:MAG: hypothetical protein K2N58_07955 [Treponemataceae bacterium]|nr:hypothetical protein [Treponemataceae bacterium]